MQDGIRTTTVAHIMALFLRSASSVTDINTLQQAKKETCTDRGMHSILIQHGRIPASQNIIHVFAKNIVCEKECRDMSKCAAKSRSGECMQGAKATRKRRNNWTCTRDAVALCFVHIYIVCSRSGSSIDSNFFQIREHGA